MKRFALTVALATLTGPAYAQAIPTSANVPTGYQVPGCTYYVLDASQPSGTRQVCNDVKTRSATEIVRGLADPRDPLYAGSSSTSASESK